MRISIFKTGTHKSGSGRDVTITPADLKRMVAAYNPEEPAPVVVGHPETDSPAYGWAKKLEVVGQELFAELTDLNDEFMRLLKTGAFKHRSVALNEDKTLRHIGFLGATPPAVKGLTPIKFNAEASEVFETNLETKPEPKPETTSPQTFAEPKTIYTRAEYEILEKALKEVMQENQYLKMELEDMRTERLKNEVSTFADQLISDGKILPANRETVIDLLLTTTGKETFAVSEPAQKIKAFLTGLPAVKLVEEFAKTPVEDKNISPGQKATKIINKSMEKK